eukprot:2167302-Alexandrium_andersonii.AAC.1
MTWPALPLTSGGSRARTPTRAQAPPRLCGQPGPRSGSSSSSCNNSSSTRIWQRGMKACCAL